MHVRIVKVRSGKTIKKYVQLVQSYRRKDGMPAQKVIANLGELSEQAVDNIKAALQASREGRTVILPEDLPGEAWPVRVLANREYLGNAVALELWNHWKLSELFNQLLADESTTVPISSVIATLVIQRCVSPGSKLYAQRWFPRTALPELLGIDVDQFNNSRLHRVLDQLDAVDSRLQQALPTRYQQKEGVFAALFMDVSDAHFEGRGCDMAERDRTKSGLRNHHKVGIVLLCNERGYPLRWKVVPGKRRDPQSLDDMVEEVRGLSWLGDAPLVCDRAMGRAGAVLRLASSGLRFLTAATVTEIDSYTDIIPYENLLDVIPGTNEVKYQTAIQQAGEKVLASGLTKADDTLYVLDLGTVKRVITKQPSNELEYSGASRDPNELEGGAAFLAKARQWQKKIEDREVKTRAELARRLNLTGPRVTQIMNLLKIDVPLQERVLRGDYGVVPERLLQDCVKLRTKDAQRRLLDDFSRQSSLRRPIEKKEVELRLVAYFNPQMFVDQRLTAQRHREEIELFIGDLNRRLLSPYSRRDCDGIHVEVTNLLAKYHLVRVYDFQVEEKQLEKPKRTCFQVQLDFNETVWRKRRRYDGWVLLVGHPDLPHSAVDIANLYREKDSIEKDFQTIKDIIKLQPVYHHTDPKVRAHVTICMLSLLLERTLESLSKRAGSPRTAPECFEELASCHLNHIQTHPDLEPAYSITQPTQEQRAILKMLRMESLVDNMIMAERLQQRPI